MTCLNDMNKAGPSCKNDEIIGKEKKYLGEMIVEKIVIEENQVRNGNCLVTQGKASIRSFLTRWSSEELRWLQEEVAMCTECDSGDEPSHPTDVLEPS